MRIIDTHATQCYPYNYRRLAMHIDSGSHNIKKRAVNLTIREDLIAEARKLNLNTSKAAEIGIMHAIKEARAAQWLEDNKQALAAHNKRIDEEGILLTPDWSV